ncbi:MAG: DNA recombination protein RmuC [Gemmatimonadales bacterium]|nr:DNA recombination protein RmuC [Gemmatimonadales bacterium]
MNQLHLAYLILLVSLSSLLLTAILLRRSRRDQARDLERCLREELRAAREEQAAAARDLRAEVTQTGRATADTVVGLLGELRDSQAAQLVLLSGHVRETLEEQRALLKRAAESDVAEAQALREDVTTELRRAREGMMQSLAQLATLQQGQLEAMTRRLTELTGSLQASSDRQTQTLGAHLQQLHEGNEKKLEEMRLTVDEKLHGTLERRLGESFALVSQRLEAVQRGLGEMQSLASGVGDLKRVLTNVRARGVWGEYQLEAILQQILTPDQNCANYRPREDGGETVEFAIRFPGRDAEGQPVYLPIDSKFPQEEYQRLLDAAERADSEGVLLATAALVRGVKTSAREVCDKYLNPPATTDFAILFLPTEGLYAEVLRQPGLVGEIQSTCHIVIAGPTTLAALLCSLRMGFRSLAIEKRSSEVWRVLGAVKTEFGKFGQVLDKVKRQLNTASNTIERTGRRTRVMERTLRQVEELPADLALSASEIPSDGRAALEEGTGERAEGVEDVKLL